MNNETMNNGTMGIDDEALRDTTVGGEAAGSEWGLGETYVPEPEEDEIATSPQDPFREREPSGPPAPEIVGEGQRQVLMKWITRVSIATNVLTIGWQVLFYYQSSAWQMLAMVGGTLAAIACLLQAERSVRRGKLDTGGYWLFVSMAFSYGVPQLLAGDSIRYSVPCVVLVTLVGGSIVLPRRWGIWLGTIVTFSVYAWLIERFEPIPRYYDPEPSILTPLAWVSGTGIYLVVVLWRIARNLRIGTIRTRLRIAFILVTLVPVIILGASVALFGVQNDRQAVIHQLESVATLKAATVNAWIHNLQTDLVTAQAGEDIRQEMQKVVREETPPALRSTAYQQVQDHLRLMIVQRQLFEEMFLMDLEARVVLSTDPAQQDTVHRDQPYFQEGLKGTYVPSPFYASTLERMSVVVAHPVFDSQGQPLGVLVGRASLETLEEIMDEQAGLGQTGITYMLNDTHVMLTGPKAAEGITRVHSEGADAVLKEHANGAGLYENHREVPVVGVYHWLPELRVALMAEQQQAEAFRAANISLITIGAAGLVAVLIAAVAAIRIAISISSPLADLAEMATRIAAGDLERSTRVERDDEVGALAQALNRMTARLRDMLRVEAERSAALEREIAERERAEAERQEMKTERERLQQEVIEAQRRTLQELSTPIIPLYGRDDVGSIIVMPLIGSIDTMRARDITRSLLAGIRQHRAKVVILDITGVPIVDSGVADHLNKTIQAARLKGARTVVTGISDAVAETIVDLGIDWSTVDTMADLQTGLVAALGSLGIRLTQ